MKHNYLLLYRLGFLCFIVGVLVGLSLSAVMVWAELEVRVDSTYPPGNRMRIKCPLLLSPAESAKIQAMIVNSTADEATPMVTEDINFSGGSPATSQVVSLAPFETQTLEWTIDSSNLKFNRLILVNIFQDYYRDNPSRLGSCGILLFSLFGLTGARTFGLLFGTSLICILLGGGLWIYARERMNIWSNATQAVMFLGGITIAALVSSAMRWWGFTLVFDSLILLTLVTLGTEFALSPRASRARG